MNHELKKDPLEEPVLEEEEEPEDDDEFE